MRIGQKVRFIGNKDTCHDNIFLTDEHLANKKLTISGLCPSRHEISFKETDHGFTRSSWLDSMFVSTIIMPSNIRVL